MSVSMRAVGGLLVMTGLLTAFAAQAQSTGAGPERALVGAVWSGDEGEDIPGYEGQGGGFVRGPVAVSPFRSLSDPRDWIVISKVEIGRDGVQARWRGADTARGSGRSEAVYFAYACKRASGGLTDPTPETGVVGLVGDRYAVDNGEFGLLHAEAAWEVAEDGRLLAIREPVVCADEGYGV